MGSIVALLDPRRCLGVLALALCFASGAAWGRNLFVVDNGTKKIQSIDLNSPLPIMHVFAETPSDQSLEGWDAEVDPIGGYLYWAPTPPIREIRRSHIDGSGTTTILSPPEIYESPTGIALDLPRNKIYWIGYIGQRIERANLDGTGREVLAQGAHIGNAADLLVDTENQRLYWTEPFSRRILQADLDAQNVTTLIQLSSPSYPLGLALDAAHSRLYWADSGADKISRANLDGTGVEDVFLGGSHPKSIAIDPINDRLYFADLLENVVKRCDLDGDSCTRILEPLGGYSRPITIAVDKLSRRIYVVEAGRGRIVRTNLDDSVRDVVNTGIVSSKGVAYDSKHAVIFWTDETLNQVEAIAVDGTNRRVVTGQGGIIPLQSPQGIVIDPMNDRSQNLRVSSDVTSPNWLIESVPAFDPIVKRLPGGAQATGQAIYNYFDLSSVPVSVYDAKTVTAGTRGAVAAHVWGSYPIPFPLDVDLYVSEPSSNRILKTIPRSSGGDVFLQGIDHVNVPTGLAIQPAEGWLYWANAGDGSIWRSQLDRSRRELVIGLVLDSPESISLELSACEDGLDNDFDGFADVGGDPGCSDASDSSELSNDSPCDNGVDDDGDGRMDFAWVPLQSHNSARYYFDPGCDSIFDESERGTLECDDGLDNDGDGRSDHPDDPECASAFDSSERYGDKQCNDGVDNDGDGLVDFPADPGCESLVGELEGAFACLDGIDNDGDGLIDLNDPSCFATFPYPFMETSAGTPCDNGIDDDGDGLTDSMDPGCDTGPERFADDSERGVDLVCDDGLDNDGDGHADYPGDPGCRDVLDEGESESTLVCDNGIDDDGDGSVDLADTGCVSLSDPSEWPECGDGLDNDGDGYVDLLDQGCNLIQMNTESPECGNGVDDDFDGTTDFPDDVLCQGPWDNDEGSNPPACGMLGPEMLMGYGALCLARYARVRRKVGATHV